MATRKGKNKRKVKSTEHVLASTTFEDPFARKRTFTQINASAGPSATTHSARVSMTVGQEPTTKRVRVEVPSQAEATNEGLKRKEKETGEKTRVCPYLIAGRSAITNHVLDPGFSATGTIRIASGGLA